MAWLAVHLPEFRTGFAKNLARLSPAWALSRPCESFRRLAACHVWSNNSVRVTARNVSASTVDLAAAGLSVQVTKRRLP